MGLEIERKYLHVNLQNLREALTDNGACCLGAHFESNWVFDTAEKKMTETGCLLRLRSQEWADRTRYLLTFKKPSADGSAFKVREELETVVKDGSELHRILEALGYAVVARYEKVREPWRMCMVEVELDVLPFGNVIELEGSAADIESVQRRLKLDKAEISTKSYHELHQFWLRQNNRLPQLSFVFDEAQRAQWRSKLGLTEQAGSASTISKQ